MSTYRLQSLFAPKSLALAGASPRDLSLGRIVLRNIREGGYKGRIQLVNPRHAEIDGVPTVSGLDKLDGIPDVLVITAPPAEVPKLVADAAALGIPAAVVITSGLGHGPGSLAEATAQAARPHGLRILGPNCLGLLVPSISLNASFATRTPKVGDLALISQSGAIASSLVEWASKRSIGFSAVASMGDAVDVDFGDLLDYFALDRKTRAILMYVESITDTRKFMSAARSAARVKPVIVVKSGRQALGAQAAATHTGALAGSDAVYDAAFRRAGLLRVLDLDELFAAAETLGHLSPFEGKRLAILTNGGGIGVLAVDRLIDFGGILATLSEKRIAELDAVLPSGWSHSNPVDIIGDAGAKRYRAALEQLISDRDNDAVLVMNCPTALASPADSAAAVVEVIQRERSRSMMRKPVLTVWVGDRGDATRIFDEAGIPHYDSETEAIRGFMHLVRYREATDSLMETPPSVPTQFVSDTETARSVVAAAIKARKTWLDPMEIEAVLTAYSIPIAPSHLARNGFEAARAARAYLAKGQAVVLKILSPDIVHKSEIDGVRLNLLTEDAVWRETDDILARARAARPGAKLIGVTVHPMVVRPKARELIVGATDDPTFGPVIVFGRGGMAVEVLNDTALALPPLDMKLARDLIDRTGAAPLLGGYRNVPPADRQALELVLVKISQLLADIPELREIDLNPVLADENGVIAVDARVTIAPVAQGARTRFAVRPYPREWESHLASWEDLRVLLRPVRPEDEALYLDFFKHVSENDLRLRFFAPVKEFSHTFIARMTQIDYARAMVFVAVDERTGEMLGGVRIHSDANYEKGEYAVLVRSDLKGRGLGWILMARMIEYARAEGLIEVEGQVLRDNTTMLRMCTDLGFRIEHDNDDPGLCKVVLDLTKKGTVASAAE
ncbi:MAG: bifunctional acetate--CoA ligase family protein/GNAT family N-acetyltransferase [Rhodoplanes sp.]|uniref:bifunctional acetate--CoA ligase family protein/GNAT family N-acetyltransferase n=1 Tax=Rhodoplanes sp. TaxID=1968906 RepID=UPI00185E256B|nr:bifunctional acetate--CoA ligase family protein/GNAT family N-acetyltransferase [Rhodoplanes sp.]NVO16452.1 bifunctional acetate--CoA ligase family protein/GNAT family N-acetyltransferase [Rhodoplanes sp.]